MATHPPVPRVVHPLPSAPDFLGRESEQAELRSFWDGGGRGVLSLIGLGGAGKTSLAARFVSGLLGSESVRPAEGLFVWSFYQEPDAERFMRELFDYFAPDSPAESAAKGTGLIHLLSEALEKGGPHLLVLDGLERVQRQAGEDGRYGQIEDPLLKSLLVRIAEGLGRTAVLVTSRFPLTDLGPCQDGGYRHMEVGELSLPAALALLRRRGVRGDDESLSALVSAYGAHALTLDHLGSLIGQFLDGNPARAPEAPALSPRTGDRQALRLARLLTAYETHLPPAELALLCRLCMLRRSVSEGQLLSLFLCSPPVHARTIRDLGDRVTRLESGLKAPGLGRNDLARLIRDVLERALADAPLAGPEEAFRQGVLSTAERAFELPQHSVYIEVEELVRQYAKAPSPEPDEKNPLPALDRTDLRTLYGHYRKLREHPLLPFKEPSSLLPASLAHPGWKKVHGPVEDLSPADVLKQLRRVERQIVWLVHKHSALQSVHELCRMHHQKWSLAGPLAPLDADRLRQVLGALIGRHLVLREADGSFTAHPAVRDHFARLGSASERGRWHELLRRQLMSLVHRPGLPHPQDRLTLDLVEEAIHHAREAGQISEAVALYEQVLGGLRHLGWKLGEMARGLRILRGFDPCPDRWALGWFLRSLGELEEAWARNDFAYFRADIRLLQGRLPEVVREGEDTRTAVAEFLMGRTAEPPPSVLGCAMPRALILLYLGRLTEGRKIATLDSLYQHMGWEGDRARGQLIAAEAARRQTDVSACSNHLQAASGWILHSGSVEHLCLFHLVRARAAHDQEDRETAQRAVHEGLHLARTCGLGLYHIELLCVQAEISLARGDAPAAEYVAREAVWRASATDCRFAWGEAQAWHLLGQALAVQQRLFKARRALKAARKLRRRIGDPRRNETERLLASLTE